MSSYSEIKFPKSRTATIDVCEIGKRKHHIVCLLEVDVTDSRRKIRSLRKDTHQNISFSAWILKVIGFTIGKNLQVASFLKGKRRLVMFEDINISFVVEKDINGEKVPFPLLIEKANEQSLDELTLLLLTSKKQETSEKDIVINRKTKRLERMYYIMPRIIRKWIWKFLMRNPHSIFKRMGNVAVTSLGMMGAINGWFIPISIHPICFGLGSIIKKPIVIDDEIKIREIMNFSVLIDHDVIDGAPFARFIKELKSNIETGILL